MSRQDQLEQKQKRISRHTMLIVLVIVILMVSTLFAFIFKTDRLYTHLFYLPIALSALWRIRNTTALGIAFGLYHLLLEWLVVGEIGITVILRACILIVIAFLLKVLCERELNYQKEIEKLSEESSLDVLTGVYNRRKLDHVFQGHLGFPVCLFIADIDGLKRINDQLGHPVGDQQIKETAEVLHKSLRAYDVLARVGGDEFCAIAQECDEQGALEILLRVENQLEKLNQTQEPQNWLSISIGYELCLSRENLKEAYQRADQKMYENKKRKYEVLNEADKRTL
ncbi:MAG: hypothetical protein BGO41_07335 [Clostridiales bacterium 38-18]|nr:MAG: hypothetical protein BGO41_07335 [Clostridiales bacterium 38-18]